MMSRASKKCTHVCENLKTCAKVYLRVQDTKYLYQAVTKTTVMTTRILPWSDWPGGSLSSASPLPSRASFVLESMVAVTLTGLLSSLAGSVGFGGSGFGGGGFLPTGGGTKGFLAAVDGGATRSLVDSEEAGNDHKMISIRVTYKQCTVQSNPTGCDNMTCLQVVYKTLL